MNVLKVFTLASGFLLSLSAVADIGQVSIDGEPVDPENFVAYKAHAIPDEQYCYPETDKFVLTSVVERLLIIEAGRAAGLDATLPLEAPPELNNEETAEDLYYRQVFLSGLIQLESDEYIEPLVGDAAAYDGKQEYLKLLAADDPLVVDVTMVRAAHIQLNTLTEAEEALERLNNGEPIDDIAGNLGYASPRYNELKSIWWHIGALPKLDGNDTPVAGSFYGPFFADSRWRIGQVLESRKLPVMLLDDRTQPFSFLSIDLRERFEQQNYNTLVKKLWGAAKIELDGKTLKHPGHDYCNLPLL